MFLEAMQERYYTPNEIAIHNKVGDLWVIVFGRVYNINSLIEECGFDSELIKPLIMFGGKDVSHWFDKETEKFLHCLDAHTGEIYPFTMHGIVPDVSSICPWWRDETKHIGFITKRMRYVRIINTLTGHCTLLETCCEDTCERIRERYRDLGYECSAAKYAWRSATTGSYVTMNCTLEENGIKDESAHFEDIGLPSDFYIPALLLEYTDVITKPFEINFE